MTAPTTSTAPDAGLTVDSPIRAILAREILPLERAIRLMVIRRTQCSPAMADQLVGEVLSDTANRALQSAVRYDPNRPAMPWLMTIAIRALQDRLRSQQRRIRHVVPVPSDQLESMASPVDEPDWRSSLVAEALARLPEPQRRIVQMRYEDDLTCEEIATRLHISVAAVRVRLHRARQALIPLLRDDEGGQP